MKKIKKYRGLILLGILVVSIVTAIGILLISPVERMIKLQDAMYAEQTYFTTIHTEDVLNSTEE